MMSTNYQLGFLSDAKSSRCVDLLILAVVVPLLGCCVTLQAQDGPEIPVRYGGSGSPAYDYWGDGLNRPDYIGLLENLTGLAMIKESNPQREVGEFIAFSKSQRDAIRTKLNELGEHQQRITLQLYEIHNRLNEESDPEQQTLLREMVQLLKPESQSANMQIFHEIRSELNTTQQRQLRELAIGIILAHNSVESIFEGAREDCGLELSTELLLEFSQSLKSEVNLLVLDRARRVREGWDRICKPFSDNTRMQIDKVMGIDILNEK